MAANTTPVFGLTPRADILSFGTANTNRDGTTGTYASGPAAGSFGTRVKGVRFAATGTTTAGVIRVWIYNGTNRYLYEEILVQAFTPSTTVRVWQYDWEPAKELNLPTGYRLDYSTHNGETFIASFNGEDY